MDTITFKITNWEKYNPRKDIKKSSWFRMEHSFLEDPVVMQLSNDERVIIVYLLSLASKKSQGECTMIIKHAEKVTRCKIPKIISTLDKIEGYQIISILKRNVHVPIKNVHVLYERDETNETNETLPARSKDVTKTSKDQQELNKNIWETFCEVYFLRYKVLPIRNASVNSKISQLAKRLGQDAIGVVKFYLNHNESFYLKNLHAIGLCLRDAESLYSQYKMGKQMDSSTVKNAVIANDYKSQLDRMIGGTK